MVNTDDFIKRLEIILDYYGINASTFADKIGVQRSSLSHLLSGRNKPSLDFILKILDIYPEIDLYWILNGKGEFPNNISKTPQKPVIESISPITNNPSTIVTEDLFANITKDEKRPSQQHPSETVKNFLDDEIEKIVFFYKDGTFKSFNPNH